MNPINTASGCLWTEGKSWMYHQNGPMGLVSYVKLFKKHSSILLPQAGNLSSESIIRLHLVCVLEKDNIRSQSSTTLLHKWTGAKYRQQEISTSPSCCALACPIMGSKCPRSTSEPWIWLHASSRSTTVLGLEKSGPWGWMEINCAGLRLHQDRAWVTAQGMLDSVQVLGKTIGYLRGLRALEETITSRNVTKKASCAGNTVFSPQL